MSEHWRTEKLEFVGEQVGLNEYEQQCSLARDCDLSGGVLRPRLDDLQVSSSAAQRACMVDVGGGTLRYKNSPGYCFAWGDDAYFLNSTGSWIRVLADGTEKTLQEINPPRIDFVHRFTDWISLDSTTGSWNVTPNPVSPPTWSNISGEIQLTFTLNNSRDLQDAAYFWVNTEIPEGADATFQFFINGTQVPGRFVRLTSWFGLMIWDAKSVDCSSVTSVGFKYSLSSTHTLTLGYQIEVEYSVPVGTHVYVVSLERNGVESVLSTPVSRAVSVPIPEIDSCGVIVQCAVTPLGQVGDVVRLYRAVEGQYVEVARDESLGQYSSVYLYDRGKPTGEYYRPSGKLPFGPATVVGNRVCVGSGRTLWISQAGNPTRFGATAINDDNQDAYSVVLPATINAVVPAEGGVLAHTRRGQYFVALSPSYDNDLLHARPPVLVDDRAAADFRAASVGAFISDGRLFVDGQLVAPPSLSNDSWVVRAGGRVYVIKGTTCLVWSPAEWSGAVRWVLPAAAQWVFTFGDDVYAATNIGIYKLAGGASRTFTFGWKTGRRFMPMLSAVRFVHIAAATNDVTIKLIRPGKPDLVIPNAVGRIHLPAQEQTHEWQLEISSLSPVYQCYITYETGVQ